MGSARWIRVALSITLLVLLGWGVLTLGFAKAGHTSAARHIAAVLAVPALRRIGEQDGDAAELIARHRSTWSTVLAPPGLGPPARTLLCVLLH